MDTRTQCIALNLSNICWIVVKTPVSVILSKLACENRLHATCKLGPFTETKSVISIGAIGQGGTKITQDQLIIGITDYLLLRVYIATEWVKIHL